ncbi:MAG: hypothetical protein PVSMB1_04130 [Gemmatimonadaceae bacterium]
MCGVAEVVGASDPVVAVAKVAMTAERRAKARAQRLRSVYGLSAEDIYNLLAAQDGQCGVCLRPLEDGKIVVDHDHVTKQIRGLLCRYCNHQVVGRHRVGLNSIHLLIRAAEYLEFPPAQQLSLGTVPVKKKKRKNRRRAA